MQENIHETAVLWSVVKLGISPVPPEISYKTIFNTCLDISLAILIYEILKYQIKI